ncbi:uncharacterized protein LOC129899290 [Solanum dulcamara]|uniref:uncharacterized protein LOC129899290 n=1 Tax=Solanum dulcamara TaxID=45834 RepID=UPI0024864DF8|nr:uncharacterized protein LOC129899290 [Solanum dulcamara]
MGSCGFGSRVEMETRWGELLGPDPSAVTEDCWVVAEEAVQEVVNCVHPTLDTEEKRKDVVDYVQRLIRCSLGCEVFSYGSVPLKTYLPDGDIDLTVFGSPIIEETLARDVLAVLQEEELKDNTEYDVKDPQFIDAEVKLVKCIVRNTVIDISFNQLGGLCTLCFLEQVDRLVGKNHLFKRSIILIKAWCYYESRVLGAHHGLISTYALETLVLFIFQLFHSSLNGPLAVLYRFLDFYSKFDWDNYCISLNGPVCKSSLPELFVEMPDYISDELLLSEEFLRNSAEMFSVPSRGLETDTRPFQQKYLNIIDPLKENNNLGRSVSKGNLYRIQRAFKYGTRKLGDILLSPFDKVADEIKKFFANTIERHRLDHVADLQYSSLIFGDEDTCSSLSPAEFYANARMLLKSSDGDFETDSLKKVYTSIPNELSSNLMNGASSEMVSENGSFSDDAAVSGFCQYRYANGPSAYVPLNLSVANGTYDCCSNGNSMSSLSWKHYHAPPFHFNKSCVENGNSGPENLCQGDLSNSCLWVETPECPQESSSIYQAGTDYSEDFWSGGSAISSPRTSVLESVTLDIGERDLASTAGDIEAMNPLVDLSGDYDSHIRSLLYGQCCYGFLLSAPVLNSPSSSPLSQNKNFWDTVRQSIPLRQNSFWQTNGNGMVVEPAAQPSGNALTSVATIGSDKKEMAQGTGIYFVNTKYYQERRCKGRTKSKAPGSHGQLHWHSGTHSNECIAFSDPNHSEEISSVRSSVEGGEKLAAPSQSDDLLKDSHTNAFLDSSCRIEFGSLGNLSEDVLPHTSRDMVLIPSVPQKVQLSKPACSKQGRAAEHSLLLKNEDEFPPLPLWKV